MLNQIVHETPGVSEIIQKASDAISFLSGRKVSLMISIEMENPEDEAQREIDNQLRRIVIEVCEVGSWELLISKNRKRELVLARQLYAYYAKQLLGVSLKRIGRAIGGRDHTTAIHSIQTVKDLVWQRDRVVISLMKQIEEKLKTNTYEAEANTNTIPHTV